MKNLDKITEKERDQFCKDRKRGLHLIEDDPIADTTAYDLVVTFNDGDAYRDLTNYSSMMQDQQYVVRQKYKET